MPIRKHRRIRDRADRFDFNEALLIEPVYNPSQRFLEAFYKFDGRLMSLQRYFEFGAKFVKTYLVESRHSMIREKATGDWVDGVVREEMTLQDDNFRDYLRKSVLVQLFSLIENLFVEVANGMAKMLGQRLQLPSKPMPEFNKYVYYFEHECGLRLKIEKETWRTVDALRDVRNRYVHELTREIPENIRQELEVTSGSAEFAKLSTDEAYVGKAF